MSAAGVGERLVVVGALGDLATRHLLPALVELCGAGTLPRGLRIRAVDRAPMSTEACRGRMRSALARHAASAAPADRESVLASVDYRAADLSGDPDLAGALADGPVTVYLDVPADVVPHALRALRTGGLVPGSRVVVEKPLGRDRRSARRLEALLRSLVDERDIVRVDHFLYHRVVQDVLAARRARGRLEAGWGAAHVERVELVWEEQSGAGGRTGFYDETGALRDMVQSHLLQLLAVVAMELPVRFGAMAFQQAREAVLRHVPELSGDQVEARTVRGRYTAGAFLPAYVDEVGVDPVRETETYAQVQLEVRTPRWEGVPFVIGTGKAIGSPRRFVGLHLRPGGLLARSTGSTVLRFTPGPQPLRPSALLLRDLLCDGQPLSVSAAEVDESWRVVDAIAARWRRGAPPLQEYVAGSAGPTVSRSVR
jgi:glucose-6-phosphate 1-dehydrogenase